MSMWTYVNGNILINTYSHTETEQSIQTFMDSLPKTSGSERPCEYHVSILDGYNVSGYKDGKTFEYQTQYSVSIVGTLRDTTVENLKKELMTILNEINKKFHIEMCCIYSYDTTMINSVRFDKKYIDRYIVCTENNYGKESVKELEFRYGDC